MRSWNRASFEYHTHSPHPPRRVTQRDFLVPLYRDRLKLLAGCAFCGLAIAVLHVWTVMWIVSVMLNDPLVPWIWLAMAFVAALATVVLFHWALVRERYYVERL